MQYLTPTMLRSALIFCFMLLFISATQSVNLKVKESARVELPVLYYLKLKGSIGTHLPITMELNKTDSFLTGHYYYDKIGHHIQLHGKIKRDGSFVMDESNNKGKITGNFSGKFSSAKNAAGIWKNPKGDKKFTFQVTANNEGAAEIILKDYSKKNCERIHFLKNKKDREDSMYDSSCSVHTLIVPVVTLTDKNAEKKINECILNSFLPVENGKRKTIADYTNDIFLENGEYYKEINENFTVSQNDKSILSIDFGFNEYSEGAAHGTYGLTLLNFDISTGKSITINDIILPGMEKKLNTIAEKLFYDTNGNESWFFEPGEFSLNNNFSLKPDGLWFVFNIYEIGPYSSGAPEVFVPFSQIKDLIRKDGILSRFNIQ